MRRLPPFLDPTRPARDAARFAARRAGGIWARFADWFNALDLNENTILLGFAVVIGIAGGLGVVLFYRLIDLAYYLYYLRPAVFLTASGILAYRPLLTGFGMLWAHLIMLGPGRGHDGLTVPDVQRAVAREGGRLAARPALARTAASAVTLGAGGAAGSEGPVAVLGAAIASFLGQAFRFDPARTKVLVAAGAAAGISAAFNAPLAGAFFALEEILGSLAVGAFPPVVVASVVAGVVSHIFLGNNPAFPIPEEYGYTLQREVFVFYPFLGLVAGLVAALFVKVFFGTESLVKRVEGPRWGVAFLGGVVVGVLVLFSKGLLVGHGHLAVHLDVFGRMSWTSLSLLALGSILATSITLNTGGSGGVFTPSLYVGAATGGAFGVALTGLFPDLGLHPEAYALVGMGAVVAAATNAPITGILLVFEMTNDYEIVVPLMVTTVIANLVARRLEPDSLYSGWLRRRGERLQHGADRDVLAGLRVADAFDPAPHVVGETAPMDQLLAHLGRDTYTDLPVVDEHRRLVGIIPLAELGRLAGERGDATAALVASQVAVPAESVAPGDSLLDAIRRMGIRGVPSIPVVDRATGHLLGLVSRAHVLALYERAVAGGATGEHPSAFPPGRRPA
ncbi:MAG TPA: chloride channel protein [Gemmatimonadales bacterium]|nr:chloride channel protein [Gemmatimonadales bacterium]